MGAREWGAEGAAKGRGGGASGVKRAKEMAGDEDRPAFPAIGRVAWSSGQVGTKTNYRKGNFTDRENLSPSGTLPLKDFTQPL